MRLIRNLIVLVLLAILVILLAGAILDGYFGTDVFPNELEPESWSAPDSWSEWRDIMIVFMGIFFVVALIMLVALFAALVFLVVTVRSVLRKNVAPAIDSLRDVLDNVRGTAEFTGETVVSPIIRVYSIVTGVRRGVGAVSNLPGRIRQRRGKK